MDKLRLWGFSLIGVCVCKLAMTLLIGVRPDPVNLLLTLIALALGALLAFRPTRDQRAHADD